MPKVSYSEEQMTERAQPYFGDAKVKEMVATSDGHFYFGHDLEIARADAKKTNAKVYIIKRGGTAKTAAKKDK